MPSTCHPGYCRHITGSTVTAPHLPPSSSPQTLRHRVAAIGCGAVSVAMLYPVTFPTPTPFCPIGESPPIPLCQHATPDGDLDLLLLKCGDLNSILYTIYSASLDLKKDKRKFDFTCIGAEPAVLARNVLVLTLVFSEDYSKNALAIWDIYNHLFLDDDTLSLLLTQCGKLAECSVDMKAWELGGYGSFVQIGNEVTLRELHRIWSLYSGTAKYSRTQKENLKAEFVSAMQKIYDEKVENPDWTVSRSAGPLADRALDTMAAVDRFYWKTGITYESEAKLETATNVNPTFAYSTQGEGFAVHKSTLPARAYHLAPVFTPTTGKAHYYKPSPTPDHVFAYARAQFRSWCEATHVCLRGKPTSKVRVRVVTCDALAFCEALRAKRLGADPSSFPRMAPWRAPILALDGTAYKDNTAPLRFDVIDTVDLPDRHSLLNTLLLTIPLLKRTPHSTLYNEMTLSRGENPAAALMRSIGGDLATMSVYLDITPVSYASGFATHTSTHEYAVFISRNGTGGTKQYHENIAWKIPSQLCSIECPLTVEPLRWVQVFYATYSNMFAQESIVDRLEGKLKLGNSPSSPGGRKDTIHFTRATLCLFIRQLMEKSEGPWDMVLPWFVRKITDSKGQLGTDYFAEMLCLLHLLKVYDDGLLMLGDPNLLVGKDDGPFRGWPTKSTPPVSCVVLLVPREKLQVLDGVALSPPPTLIVDCSGTAGSEVFACIETMFGKLSIEGEHDSAVGVIEEDITGRNEDSCVIVSVCVPSLMLVNDPKDCTVALKVADSPSASALAAELGSGLELFKSALMDDRYVHVLTERPTISTATRALVPYAAGPPEGPPPGSEFVIVVPQQNYQGIKAFIRRVKHDNRRESAILRRPNGRAEIVATQVAASAVQLAFSTPGLPSRIAEFPYVIGGRQIMMEGPPEKGSSMWTDVVVRPSRLGRLDVGGGQIHRFPLLRENDVLIPWNIHRVNLDRLPAMSMSNLKALEWANPLAALSFSDRENAMKRDQVADAFVNLKCSLHTLFLCAAGVQGDAKVEFFGLQLPDKGTDLIFFVPDVRLDLANHTMVLDAFVLPLRHEIISKVVPDLMPPQVCWIGVDHKELVAWKALLPSFVERCRTWEHASSCEYRKPDAKIPLSTEFMQPPICSCGSGVVTESFKKRKEWHSFAPYVTRVAIGMLFPVMPYLDPVGLDPQRQDVGLPSEGALPSQVGDRCSHCEKWLPKEKRLGCGKCKKAVYCDRQCQTKDWPNHRKACETT